MESRKQHEAAFHDQMRGIHEQDPARFAHFLGNKKFYSITDSSSRYMNQLLAKYCPEKSVLDFGCGSGALSMLIAPIASHVDGIDLSADSVSICRSQAQANGLADRATFHVMDCENTTFADQTFDVIFESGVLHHLDLEAAYREMRRLLKPGGIAICMEALRHNYFIQRYRRRTPQLRTQWETEHILGEPEIDSATRYFARVDKRFFHLASLAAVPLRGKRSFKLFLAVLEAIDRVVLRVPFVRRQAWISVFVLHVD